PSVPIEIASLTVMVPKTWGMAPAAWSASPARAASRSRPALHGVRLLYAFAMPTIGLPKSASPKPTARSIARLGARSTPSVPIPLGRWGEDVRGPPGAPLCTGSGPVPAARCYLGSRAYRYATTYLASLGVPKRPGPFNLAPGPTEDGGVRSTS